MKKIILDTSVVVKWFSQEEGSNQAEKLLHELQEEKIQIILPELVKYELANALLKGKKLSFIQAQKALKVFYKLPLIFTSEDQNLSFLTYKIAKNLKITYYDACFISLAKQEKATLITANPKHQRKIKGVRIQKL